MVWKCSRYIRYGDMLKKNSRYSLCRAKQWSCEDSYRYSSCSAQKWSWKVVGRRQCAQGNPCLCKGSSASRIVDLTFHGQPPTSQVQRQPPCTGRFANRTNAVWPMLASGQTCSLATDMLYSVPLSKLQWKGTNIILASSVIWPILAEALWQQPRFCARYSLWWKDSEAAKL